MPLRTQKKEKENEETQTQKEKEKDEAQEEKIEFLQDEQAKNGRKSKVTLRK